MAEAPAAAVPATPADATPATAATPATPPADAPPKTTKSSLEALKHKAKETASTPAGNGETKPAAAVDPDMAAVERILRDDDRIKTERKVLKAEREALKAERDGLTSERSKVKERDDRIASADAARAKGDPLGFLRAHGFTDAEIFDGDDAFVFKLADARVRKPELDIAAQTDARVKAALAERDAATEAEKKAADEKATADKKAADEKVAADHAAAVDVYSADAATEVAAHPEKYPTLLKLGKLGRLNYGDVTQYAYDAMVEASKKGEKLLVEPPQALEALEKKYAEEFGPPPPVEPPKKDEYVGARVRGSVNPAWSAQTGSPSKPAAGGLKDRFAALKQRAREKTT